jgi:hypothetical protein
MFSFWHFLIVIAIIAYVFSQRKAKKPRKTLNGFKTIVVRKEAKELVNYRTIQPVAISASPELDESESTENANQVYLLIDHLSRTATKHSKCKNWGLGAHYLLEAKRLMEEHQTKGYSVEALIRLPLFLQHAGQYDFGIAECELLLASAEERVKQNSPGLGQLTQSLAINRERALIYDKMRLMSKREKLKDKEVFYKQKCLHETIFFEKKQALCVVYEEKAKNGDRSACNALGHEWGAAYKNGSLVDFSVMPRDSFNIDWTKKVCKRCLELREGCPI